MVFVAIQPESGARIHVTVETNRRSDYPRKLVSAGLAGFDHVDFGHFSFGTNRKPKVKRVKLKVKKATFYKLIFESSSASASTHTSSSSAVSTSICFSSHTGSNASSSAQSCSLTL